MNDELVRQLAQRARSESPSDRVVTADEVLEWPEGAFDALLGEGILREIKPAMTVECDACFDQHAEMVEFVKEPPGSELRAYIVCPEFGRVKVDPQRMRRWEIQSSALEQYSLETTDTETSKDTGDVKTQRETSTWPPTAQAFVEILRQARDSGTSCLHWKQIKERLGARGYHPDRVHDVRRYVAGWDDVVDSPRRGIYQLKS